MSTSINEASSVATAFAHIVDYAGLFPPASLAMPQAAREYAEAARGLHAWMLGRYVVPASKLGQFPRAWTALENADAVKLSVIVDARREEGAWPGDVRRVLAEIAAFRDDGPAAIEALEVPLPSVAATSREVSIRDFAALLDGAGVKDLPVYIELARDERFFHTIPEAIAALAACGFGAKLRCGGPDASAVPSIPDVRAFIFASIRSGVAFKATAGLHHPLRHFNDAAGHVMHGFVNLLAASVFAGDVDEDEIEALIAEEASHAFSFSGDALRWRNRTASLAKIAHARRTRFIGFGSCSFAEPVGDLISLGILRN
jgi:hypothetical protein